MNGPEHYAEAERLLRGLSNPHHSSYGTRAERTAEAQAHATLALAAATAATRSTFENRDGQHCVSVEWQDVNPGG